MRSIKLESCLRQRKQAASCQGARARAGHLRRAHFAAAAAGARGLISMHHDLVKVVFATFCAREAFSSRAD